MNATDVIAYTADADNWCEPCITRTYGVDPGQPWYTGDLDVDDWKDSESNPIRPVFAADEWWNPSDWCEGLYCAGCRRLLDVAHADGCGSVISDSFEYCNET